MAVAASVACLVLWGALSGTAHCGDHNVVAVDRGLIRADCEYRKRTIRIEHERGWKAAKLERAAFLAENAGQAAGGCNGNCCTSLPVSIMTASAFMLYDSMPANLPIHERCRSDR